jgi:hypothetical protein
VTVTFVAVFGPLSVSVTVKVMMSPTLGFALFVTCVSARSDSCGVTVSETMLFAALGSGAAEWRTLAVFVRGPGVATVAWRPSVRGEPFEIVPTVQTPVTEEYVPWLGLADTKLRPDGSLS